MHKRLSELENMWVLRCTDGAKNSRVRMASEQRLRIVVSAFSRALISKLWNMTTLGFSTHASINRNVLSQCDELQHLELNRLNDCPFYLPELVFTLF